MKRPTPAGLANLVFSGVGGGLTALLLVLPLKHGLAAISHPLDRNRVLIGFLLPFFACLAGAVLLERKSEMPFGDCFLAGLIGIVLALSVGLRILLDREETWGLVPIAGTWALVVLPMGVWCGRLLRGLLWRLTRRGV